MKLYTGLESISQVNLENFPKLNKLASQIYNDLELEKLSANDKSSGKSFVELSWQIAETTQTACGILGLNPNKINYKISDPAPQWVKDFDKKFAKSWNGHIVAATKDGILIPESTLIKWSKSSDIDKIVKQKTIAHELHHVWAKNKFPNYNEKKREVVFGIVNRIMDYKEKGQELPSELLEKLDVHRNNNLFEKSAILFEHHFFQEYLLPKISNRVTRAFEMAKEESNFYIDYSSMWAYRFLNDIKI